MLIRSIKGVDWDIPDPNTARFLIHLGFADEVKPPEPTFGPTVWSAGRSTESGEVLLSAECPRCKGMMTYFGTDPSSRQAQFQHCRGLEKCPKDVAQHYLRLRKTKGETISGQPSPRDARMQQIEVARATRDNSTIKYEPGDPGGI